MTAIEKLRADIGLKNGELLTNSSGEVADILSVDGDTVTLGVVSSGRVIQVPRENILPKKPD